MRLDVLLFEKGFAESRTRAADMIRGGHVSVDGRNVQKPSYDADDSCEISVSHDTLKYVSRAALKLLAAKENWKIDFKGLTCVDLGASTGGFCEVMLESGAAKVYAVDIGHGQLHKRILSDSRVKSFEGVNARNVSPAMFGGPADAVTCDLSFISQTLVLQAVSRITKDGGIYVGLIKPQFESRREDIGKGGIVKDARVRAQAVERVISCANTYGLVCMGVIPSPIAGGDGNLEYLAAYTKRQHAGIIPDRRQIDEIVGQK